MSTHRMPRRGIGVASIMILGALAAVDAASGEPLQLSQVPLALLRGADPNLMLILDNSASMNSAQVGMPGWTENDAGAILPTASDFRWIIYYEQDALLESPCAVELSRRLRSADGNPLYYDPRQRYRPWIKDDGVSRHDNVRAEAAYPGYPDTGTMLDLLQPQTTRDWLTAAEPIPGTSCRQTLEETKGILAPCPIGADKLCAVIRYHPITYYFRDTKGQFVRVEIYRDSASAEPLIRIKRGDNPPLPASPVELAKLLKDEAGTTRSVQDEIQNFANWYQYYRTRRLAMQAAVGEAFATQPASLRLGLMFLDSPERMAGIDNSTVSGTAPLGVRPFSRPQRQNFYAALYGATFTHPNTPLRKVLDSAGQYFSRTDDSGPWGNMPADGKPQAVCRASYAILATDGYFDPSSSAQAETEAARADVDSTRQPDIAPADPDKPVYSLEPRLPYADGVGGTLADVAMYYWGRDLNVGLANAAPDSPGDPAYWQHLSTYAIGFGVTGSIAPNAANRTLLESGELPWPNPFDGASGAADNLWHATLDGRGRYLNATNPQQIRDALGAFIREMIAAVRSSGTSTATSSGALEAGTRIFQASFNSGTWSGDIRARELDPSTGEPKGSSWSAATQMKTDEERENTIYTYDPARGGVEFDWLPERTKKSKLRRKDKVLSDAQKRVFEEGMTSAGLTDVSGEQVIDFLRGDRSLELANGGKLRDRAPANSASSPLGDIINSDPVYLGASNFNYARFEGYTAFQDKTRQRTPLVFAGANDGMVHAFDAATGNEVFAYVPNVLLGELPRLAHPDYNRDHHYFADGPQRIADAVVDGKWRTLLLGSPGAGGKGVFALDVTGDSDDHFEKPAKVVLWEFTDSELGSTLSAPTVVSLASNKGKGDWFVAFGNGYNSASQQAALLLVDVDTGNEYKSLDTGIGSEAEPNGLASPVPVDLDGDGTTDLLYAGDLQGNLWRFDMRIDDKTRRRKESVTRVFQAKDQGGKPQPITSRPAVGPGPDGKGVMIYFGTGRYMAVGDQNNADAQAFYGIWDADFGDRAVTGAELKRTSLTDLEHDTVKANDGVDVPVRAVGDQTPFDWKGNPEQNKQPQKGWHFELPASGERVIASPIYRSSVGRVLFTTLIPKPTDNPCADDTSGWLMELGAFSGASPIDFSFDVNRDAVFSATDQLEVEGEDKKVSAAGIQIKGIAKTPGFVIGEDRIHIFVQTPDGKEQQAVINTAVEARRQTWRQFEELQ